MLIQISGGQGPTECSLAVEKLCKVLQKEFKNTRIVSINNDYSGFGYKSWGFLMAIILMGLKFM